MRYHLKMARLRVLSFMKDRFRYASTIRPPFEEDWRKHFWSLFVTWACDFDCSYCIQGFGIERGRRGLPHLKPAAVEEFLKINAIEKHLDEPIDRLVIQGGEPLLYKDLPRFCENVRVFRNITIVSNLSHDVSEYIRISHARRDLQIKFVASYHHEFLKPSVFLDAARRLRDEGMLDWVDFVDVDYRQSVRQWKKIDAANVNCKPFRFVGERNGRIYPHKARQACNGQMREVDCFTTFVLISPDANVYNCHAKMYRGQGHVCRLDEFPEKFNTGYLRCNQYGLCQPCQIDMVRVRKPKRQTSP